MSQTPLVSVIMPAHNCEATIRQSIQSALNQSFTDFEVVIVDDCSTDNTAEIITDSKKSDLRVRAYKNEKNMGVATSRNYAIEKAFGSYIAFLDSDDLWEPNKLKSQLDLIHSTGCGLCYSSYDYFDEDNNAVYRPYLVPDSIDYSGLLKENVIGLSTVFLKKNDLSVAPFDKGFFHEDYALWLKLLRQGIVARGLPEVLTHNRIGGRSQNKWKAFVKRWEVYRESEGLSILKSCECMVGYVRAGVGKYRG